MNQLSSIQRTTDIAMANDTLVKLRAVLIEDFDIPVDTIFPEARLYEDLDIDSIDAIDLIVRLKEITGKKIPPERFKEVRTIGDVVDALSTL